MRFQFDWRKAWHELVGIDADLIPLWPVSFREIVVALTPLVVLLAVAILPGPGVTLREFFVALSGVAVLLILGVLREIRRGYR